MKRIEDYRIQFNDTVDYKVKSLSDAIDMIKDIVKDDMRHEGEDF